MRMRRLTMLWAAYRGSCHRARRLRATACRGRAPPRAIPRRRRPWISSSTRRAGRSRSRPWRGRRRWGRNWAAWAGTRRIPGTPPSPPPPPPSLPPSLSFLSLRPTNRSIDQYPIYLYQSKKKLRFSGEFQRIRAADEEEGTKEEEGRKEEAEEGDYLAILLRVQF